MAKRKTRKAGRRAVTTAAPRKRTVQRKHASALESLMRNTAGATGETFFRTLVRELTTTMKVRAAFAGRIADGSKVVVLAGCEHGKLLEGAATMVPTTLSAELISKRIPIVCPRNARKKHPEAQMFHDLHVEAFIAVPLTASNGTPLGVLVMMHDKPMTKTAPALSLLTVIASRASAELERMETEDQRLESEFRMRAIIDGAPFGAHLYELQPDGRLVFVSGNRSADRMLGIRHHELVGKTIEEAFPGLTEQGVGDTYRKVASTGIPFEKDLVSYAQGQISGAFEVHAFQTSKDHVTAFFRDITERRRAEAHAEEESRVKTTLLTNISHEFRTPITGILGLASLLRDQTADTDHQDMLDGITASATRLHTTLDSIFKLAQLTSGDISPKAEAVSLDWLFAHLHHRFGETAERKGITLSFPASNDGVAVLGDPDLVGDILAYLIDNAIKYTDKGGVTLLVRKEATDSALRCLIMVQDTGIGIAPEHHEEIFREFRQISEGYGRTFEGTGLGLAIARHMARMLGGSIALESSVGNGSTFTVSLPAIADATQAREISPPEAAHVAPLGHKPRVLIVEDNFINKLVMQNFLADVCTTDHARNARMAIEMARTSGYDAILMDINLGAGMNGIEATEEIRKIPGYQGTPIVAVTGYTRVGDRERILAHGLTHYLPKPFDRKEIVEIIASVLTSGGHR